MQALQKRIADVQAVKLKSEEAKFIAGVSLEDLRMWSATVDAQLVNVDVEVVTLGKYIEQLILTENKKLEEAAAKEAWQSPHHGQNNYNLRSRFCNRS